MSKSKDSKKKRTPDRQISLADRVMNFIKVNEKLIWVILLVLISFSFAFTGATQSFLQGCGSDRPAMRIEGDVVTISEIQRANVEVAWVNSMREIVAAAYQRAGMLPEVLDFLQEWSRARFSSEGEGYSMVDFFLFLREADRLGIYVSDAELGHELRRMYWSAKTIKDIRESTLFKATGELDKDSMARMLRELSSRRAWNFREWESLLKEFGRPRVLSPRAFEEALRRYIRAQKVVEYVRSSVQVTMDEVYERFLEEEELRKVSFFRVEPDESLEKTVASEITFDEIEDYYREHEQEFAVRYGSKLRFTYLYIPFEHFREGLEPTEEEIEAHYLKIRDDRYRQPLEVDDTGFDLLSPEEQKEREKKLYVSLEEVKDEVRDLLIEELSKQRAEEFAREIKNKAFPPKKATLTTDADSEPPEPEEEAEGASFQELAAEYDFIEVETTPFFYQWEKAQTIDKADSSQVTSWFSTLSANSREEDESKHRPVVDTESYFTTTDGSGLVLYTDVQTLSAGDESLELLQDAVREKLTKVRVLDKMEDRVDAMVERVRSGDLSFEELAAEVGARVHSSAFVKRTEFIYIPVEEEEDEPSPESESEDDRPKTEYFRGSRLVLAEAFLLDEEGAIGDPVRDEAEGVYYAVRLDGILKPAPEDFDDATKKRLFEKVRDERREIYFQEWRKNLYASSQIEQYTARVQS